MKKRLLGIISVSLNAIYQLFIQALTFYRHCRKKWDYNETIPLLFIDYRKLYNSEMNEVLYNILFELGAPMNLVRLIELC
jgi:hypothetical protein